ncbi:aldehyde dehydrogenase family protein [Mycolicibacterium sp. XJ870]
MTVVTTTNPATNTTKATDLREATGEDVARACRAASDAALQGLGTREERAQLLRMMADAFEIGGQRVAATAIDETALSSDRLNGEMRRVCYQLRAFADAVAEGGYLEATIDLPCQTDMGPRPDLRRMLVPIGPVAVFGASNFPLAFSMPGGDTVAALAAGCPVVVKAHPAHPLTSQACYEIMSESVAAAGFDQGILQIVHGFDAGRALVLDPHIRAVAFTGSALGGQALTELIAERREPIPFYGELSGINPAIVTLGAATERPQEIADGLAGAVTGSGGQLCTKPGVILVPDGDAGDNLVSRLRQAVGEVSVALLSRQIAQSYRRSLVSRGAGGLIGEPDGDRPCHVRPALVELPRRDSHEAVWEEIFGPSATVIRYGDVYDLKNILASVPGTLAVSIHHGSDEADLVVALSRALLRVTGRLVYNQQTTGVAVSWAQTHGGPWPSTTSHHTSVGLTSMRRFLRPVTWQGAPSQVLPTELVGNKPVVPTRVDGQLLIPPTIL